MNELQIALLVVGLVLIAVIYLWNMRPNLSRNALKLRRRRKEEESVSMEEMPLKNEDNLDYAETLSGLSGVLREDHPPKGKPLPVEQAPRKTNSAAPASRSVLPQLKSVLPKKEATPQQTASPPPDPAPQCIIVLYITSPAGESFKGMAIRSAAEAVGMRFGQFGVFHHFGVGESRSKQSLFCLASMYEPGKFDLSQISTYQTAGLVLIMRLPLPIDGQVAFELMLNTAQRLAKRLSGDLRDDKRELLTPSKIESLRSLVADVSPSY
jgi:cell division protein ZipA